MNPQSTLCSWYARNARDLPWRRNPSAYRIWISEIMLQQTRVEAVREKYIAFLKRFPTVRSLAQAGVDEVLQAWSGLGYYRRARMLHAAARQIVEQHGQVPRDHAALLKLPGVGRYTAGAIASIAFNHPQPIVDGNIERVFARLYAITEPIKTAATRSRIWQFARDWVEHGAAQGLQPRNLNQALMELGATVCMPRSPRCDECPLAGQCQAAQNGNAEGLPVLPRRKQPRKIRYFAACVTDDAGRVLMLRRHETSRESLLPAGLWEFPHVTWDGKRPPLKALKNLLGAAVTTNGQSTTRRHTIMDYRLSLQVTRARLSAEARPADAEARWFTLQQATQAAQASATAKLLRAVSKQHPLA